MKAKKLLSILLFSLLICTMLVVYASAANSHYFTGEYLYNRLITSGSFPTTQVVSVADDGSLHLTRNKDVGRANTQIDITNSWVSTAYSYVSVKFKSNWGAEVQFWPFSATSAERNTADGTKLLFDGTTFGSPGNWNTNNGAWHTGKYSFKSSELSGGYTTVNDVQGDDSFTWKAKSDGELPTQYTKLTFSTESNSTRGDDKYVDIQYIAMHNGVNLMYAPNADEAESVMSFLNDGWHSLQIAPNTTGTADKDYATEQINAEFEKLLEAKYPDVDAAKITVVSGANKTTNTPSSTSPKEFDKWEIVVDYKSHRIYAVISLVTTPEYTVTNHGAQIRSNADTADLRFMFSFDMSNFSMKHPSGEAEDGKLSYTSPEYQVRIGAFVCTEEFVDLIKIDGKPDASKVQRVIVTPGGKAKYEDGVYDFNIVVTGIPDKDTNIVVTPFIRYTFGGSEENYVLLPSITRSVNEVKAKAIGNN